MLDNWENIDQSGQSSVYSKYLQESRKQFEKEARENPEKYYSWLQLKKEVSILDVGCGTGFDVENLKAAGYNVIGIDKNFTLMPHNSDNPRLKDGYLQLDVYRLHEFYNRKFDRVFASTLFQHLDYIDSALDQMIGVTRLGGLVAVRDTDWNSLSCVNYPALTEMFKHQIYHMVKQPNLGAILPEMFKKRFGDNVSGYQTITRNFNIGMFECSLDTVIVSGWKI